MLVGLSDATPGVAGGGAVVAAAAWDTRNVCPPIVRFAERAAPVLAATE